MASAKYVNGKTGENTTKLFLELVWDWFRFGCSDEDFLLMEFYRKNRREKKRWLTSAKNNRFLYKTVYDDEARRTFDNKEYFDQRFKHLMKHDVLVLNNSTKDEIISFINKYEEVIIKPANGACGVGIYKLKKNDRVGFDELTARLKKGENLIMEQLIVQHQEMARMNPTSVNTIRVITMVDRNGDTHIINTLAKFGGSENCISNTLSGGISCHINPETGIVDHPGYDKHGEDYVQHPVSKVTFPGFQIPNWSGVCDFAIQLSKVVPSGRYIGWDIVITENGYDVLEGNIHPGQEFQRSDKTGRWNMIKQYL